MDCRPARGDGETSAFDVIPPCLEITVKSGHGFHQWPRQSIQQLAFRSDLDPRSAAFEQCGPEFALQCLHLQRYGRLGEMETGSRFRHAAQLKNCAKSAKLLKPVFL